MCNLTVPRRDKGHVSAGPRPGLGSPAGTEQSSFRGGADTPGGLSEGAREGGSHWRSALGQPPRVAGPTLLPTWLLLTVPPATRGAWPRGSPAHSGGVCSWS